MSDPALDAYRTGYARAIEDCSDLVGRLFEVIEHGDFSNGVVTDATGTIDEGAVMTARYVDQLKVEAKELGL